MRQFSEREIAHVMDGDVLSWAFDDLERQFVKQNIEAATPEKAEGFRQQIIALRELKKKLKGMRTRARRNNE